jgi:alpha-galactosidase
VLFEGDDWTGRLLEGFENHPTFSKTQKVRIDVLRRFGYYSTESNGHLSEYLPWYRKRPREIRKWIDLSHWIHGETGGYLRVCTERNDWWETEFPKWLEGEGDPITPEKRSNEHGSYIIESLVTGRTYRGHFNVPNEGIITNLPCDAIVEVPGYVDANGVSIPTVGELPMGPAAICDASINVQRLSVHAALTGDVGLLKQAMMIDPLTGAVLDTEEISQMTDEMLIAQADWLPQYAQEIPAAKKRIAAVKRAKTYKGTKTSRGAARLEGKRAGRKRTASGKPRRARATRKADQR